MRARLQRFRLFNRIFCNYMDAQDDTVCQHQCDVSACMCETLQTYKHPFENRSRLYRFHGVGPELEGSSDDDDVAAHGWCAHPCTHQRVAGLDVVSDCYRCWWLFDWQSTLPSPGRVRLLHRQHACSGAAPLSAAGCSLVYCRPCQRGMERSGWGSSRRRNVRLWGTNTAGWTLGEEVSRLQRRMAHAAAEAQARSIF